MNSGNTHARRFLFACLGVGCAAFWEALEAGRSGIDWLPETRGTESPFRFAARLKDFDAKQFVQPRKTIKVMCLEIQAAYAAAALAMQDAGLAKGAIEPERLGVVLGSEMLYGDLDEMIDVCRDAIDLRGSDLRIGFVRGIDIDGDWGFSFVNTTIDANSTVDVGVSPCSRGTCGTFLSTVDKTHMTGFEFHQFHAEIVFC